MILLSIAFALSLVPAAEFKPAKFAGGDAPLPAPLVLGWEEVLLQVSVSASGAVERIGLLRAAEPLAGALRSAVAGWSFEPARDGNEAVSSEVLVAAVYRPPALFNHPALGSRPVDLAAAPEQVPFPTAMWPASFPPRVRGSGVVVVEALVGAGGDVLDAKVVRSTASGFNDTALAAARSWQFRPARRDGAPVRAYAYLVFGFREPVVTPRR